MMHLLKQYAESSDLASAPGYSAVNIRYVIAFTRDGTFASIAEIGEGKRGRRVPGCPQFSLSELKAMGSGSRHFLVDSLDVIGLLTSKPDQLADEKLTAKHGGFIRLLREASDATPATGLIADGLETSLEQIREELRGLKAKPTDKATVAIEKDGRIEWLIQDDSWRPWYESLRSLIAEKRSAKSSKKAKLEPAKMRCLLTGDLVVPVATHSKIKGLSDVGGHTSGDVLASFKQEAFQHFGLKQAANSAMSDEAMTLYVTALNKLITNAVKVGEVKVLYWFVDDSEGRVEPIVDPFACLFEGFQSQQETDHAEVEAENDSAEDAAIELKRRRHGAEASAKDLIELIREGGDRKALQDGRYVALSIAANTTRVVIREVRQGRFEDLSRSLDRWQKDLRIRRLNGNPLPMQKLDRLVTATLRDRQTGENYDNWIAPAAVTYAALWNAALMPVESDDSKPEESVSDDAKRTAEQNLLKATAIKAQQRLVLSMLNGEVAEALDDKSPTMRQRRSAYYARISLLKLYLARTPGSQVMDDLNDASDNSAYHAGRVLAVFQHIQTLSSGEPKASFLDRYYAAASTTPYQVLPKICNIALKHLKRIQPRVLRDELTELLAAIHERIDSKVNSFQALELDDQFQFQLGFFQQQSHLPNKNTVRRVQTNAGYTVRSKAEATIANILHAVQDELADLAIAILYEPPFVEINGEKITSDYTGKPKPIKADWVVQSGKSDRTLVIEHFGMRDLQQYTDRMNAKLAGYSKSGVLHVQSTDVSTDDLRSASALLVTSDEDDFPDFERLKERFTFAIQNL